MSENENFIEEVTEEVRREKLYVFLRRYGWVGLLFVLLIVIGSVVFEIRSSNREKSAQRLGDALGNFILDSQSNMNSLSTDEKSTISENSIISLLVKALVEESNGNKSMAIDNYKTIIADHNNASTFVNLAKFRLLMLIENDLEEREKLISELIVPGNPFFLLALERRVLQSIREGDYVSAKQELDLLLANPEASQFLISRATQLRKALNVGEHE